MIDSDEQKYREHAEHLRQTVAEAAESWLLAGLARYVDTTIAQPDRAEAIAASVTEIDDRLRLLAASDPDEARSGPLELIRQSTGPVQRWLATQQVPAPVRDAWDERSSPGDTYALGPMTFSDLGDAVHQAGITWGAAKAHIHLRRRNQPDPEQSA